MKRAVLLTLLALGFAAPPAARAFIQLRTSAGKDQAWDLDTSQPNVVGGRITYYLHPDGTNDLPASQAFAAVRRAIASWEDAPDTRLAFLEDSSRPADSHKSGDRVNLVRWVDGDLDPFTLGSTFPTFKDGRLRDADLLLNDAWFRWSVSTPGANGRADVEAVVAHEWGHLVGLDHVSVHGATMFYAAPLASIYFRTLHGDDEAAVASLYPSADYARNRAVIRGSVDVAGRTNDRGVHVIAADAVTGEVAVSTFTDSDGTFALRGLLPGTYRLAAAPFFPLEALNGYWKSASTSFLPSPLTEGGANPGPTRLLTVAGGDEVTGVALTVADRDAPFEPDGATSGATPIEIGDSVASRIESIDDRDHYRFPGRAGQKVSIYVHAAQIGSDVDPIVDLIAPDERTVLASHSDVRSEFVYARRVEGADVDARIRSFTLPADGEYYIRVRVSATSGWGLTSSFYLLVLAGGFDAPDAGLSGYSANPPAIDAGGAAASEIRVVPRNVLGEVIGPGVRVEIESTGGGAVGPTAYLGGGVYAATVTSAPSPGADPLTVRMSTPDGSAVAPGAVVVSYVGPPDAARSELSADPRRIPADGSSATTILFLPRDALGQALGPGRAVAMALAEPGAGTLSPVADGGDGTYVATLTATAGAEGARVVAGIGDLELALDVPFGFDLLDVVRDVLEEAEALLAAPATPARSRRKLEKASAQLAAARDALTAPDPDTGRALALAAKAAKSLEKAQKRGGEALNLDPSHSDLARAARATARAALDAVVTGGDPRIEKRLARAERKFEKGEEALAEGRHSKAAKRYGDAWRKAVKL